MFSWKKAARSIRIYLIKSITQTCIYCQNISWTFWFLPIMNRLLSLQGISCKATRRIKSISNFKEFDPCTHSFETFLVFSMHFIFKVWMLQILTHNFCKKKKGGGKSWTLLDINAPTTLHHVLSAKNTTNKRGFQVQGGSNFQAILDGHFQSWHSSFGSGS